MSDKKSLIELCKALGEAVKEGERDFASEGRKLTREAEEALESEKKMMRAGHEERLQKVC